MSRIIKFRVWVYLEDKISGQMLSCHNIDFMSGGPKCRLYIGKQIIMQYTGLKDKNGKEIYEADIVKDTDYDIKSNCVIEYHVDGFNKKDYKGEYWSMYNSDDIEVIGNIYQNPELLE